MKTTLRLTALTALLGLALATPGLRAADSGERAKEIRGKIENARSESAKIRSQVGLTLEELNRLQKDSIELRPQFDKYVAELVKMEEQARIAGERAASMGDQGKAFFQAWENQINTIANADIREQAKERYSKRLKSYSRISNAAIEARDQLLPFMSDLNDIKKMLDIELTRGTVKAVQKLSKQANSHGEDVVESLKEFEAELDRVSAELAKYQ